MSEEKYLHVECKHCEKSSKLAIIGTHTVMEALEDPRIGDEHAFPVSDYYFCRCINCEDVSLVHADPLRPLYEGKYTIVFPVEKRFVNFELPEMVKRSYQEAVSCERSKLPIATVVMVGRTLEAIINDITKEKMTIFKGLEKLKEDGTISEDIYNWSNELRVLRNIGAHPSEEEVAEIDATESMDFLQAILEIVYHLRPKFEEMKERRTKIC